MKHVNTAPNAVADRPLIDDREGAERLGIALGTFLQLQKEPDFPDPVWLSERTKRHVTVELDAWAMSRRQRPEGAADSIRRAAAASVASRRAKRVAKAAAQHGGVA